MYSKLCHNVDYKVGFVLFLVYYQGDTEAYISDVIKNNCSTKSTKKML